MLCVGRYSPSIEIDSSTEHRGRSVVPPGVAAGGEKGPMSVPILRSVSSGRCTDVNRIVAVWSASTYYERGKMDGEAVSVCVYERMPGEGSGQDVVEDNVAVVEVPEKGIEGSWIDLSVKNATRYERRWGSYTVVAEETTAAWEGNHQTSPGAEARNMDNTFNVSIRMVSRIIAMIFER